VLQSQKHYSATDVAVSSLPKDIYSFDSLLHRDRSVITLSFLAMKWREIISGSVVLCALLEGVALPKSPLFPFIFLLLSFVFQTFAFELS